MRMQPVLAAREALFINDAYNAAPTSMRAALSFINDTTLRDKKWIVLGDMLELGEDEQAFHESFATQILSMDLEGILLYGPRMKMVIRQTAHRNYKYAARLDRARLHSDYRGVRTNTDKNSVILLKGSRGMALENVLSPLIEEVGRK